MPCRVAPVPQRLYLHSEGFYINLIEYVHMPHVYVYISAL